MGGLFRVVKDLAAFRSWQRMNFLMHTSKHAKSSWRYCHQFFSPQDLEILICPMWVEIFKIAPIQTSIFCRRSDRTCMCSVSLVPFFFLSFSFLALPFGFSLGPSLVPWHTSGCVISCAGVRHRRLSGWLLVCTSG